MADLTTPEAQISEDPAEAGIRSETREVLLDAAERLFARVGIERASLRAITREAGANLASVHYHFGSKDALIQAVFARRLGPINRERVELLTRLQEEAGSEAVPLHDILFAFVEPVMRMLRHRDPAEARAAHELARLVVQALNDPEGPAREIVLREFHEVKERFLAALARALPDLPREDLFWRFHFMVGAMAHTASSSYMVAQLSDGLCDACDVDGMTERLVAFVAAGLQGPSVEVRR